MEVETVQPQRLHERVVQHLVTEIVGGVIAPGDALPTEPDLAQRYGVSRTVVREAVRILAAKGLVSVRQGSGMRVLPKERWDHLDPLVIFEQVRLHGEGTQGDVGLLDELIETRRILETEIAALAAERRNAEDLRALEAALSGMEIARNDAETYTKHDIVFHDAILIAARNRLLREALRPVTDVLAAGRYIAIRRAGVISRSLPSHYAIHAAIAAHDAPAAREAMRAHILLFEEDIKAGLRAGTQ